MADTAVAGLRLGATWGLDFPERPGERSFVAMGGELLAGAPGDDGQHVPGPSGPPPARPLDYLVVAYEAYDAAPAGLAAGFLADACPGDPRAFSIADQGIGAPFSGLKVLDRIHRGGGLSDAALFVLDPAAGAVLALGGTGGWGLEALAEERAGEAADCLPLLPSAPRTSYVLGDGLRDLTGALAAAGATVRTAESGHGCAGVWRALRGALAAAADEGAERLVIADRDRGLGRLHSAVFARV
ncbi:hypothetical protein [Streptomyces sp. ME19-01-6]|uniref:hypothetical protein n=1 Tax=Streptomyces sp. ME19-01-6 TaxID=3028686 RepID=UPI0029B12E4C|nr:hypothetical protein [Streptomyces sp. ME19-01-6]MDX3231454.1 hypothetical protein [Streptomyces sp. ME19-01-6]